MSCALIICSHNLDKGGSTGISIHVICPCIIVSVSITLFFCAKPGAGCEQMLNAERSEHRAPGQSTERASMEQEYHEDRQAFFVATQLYYSYVVVSISFSLWILQYPIINPM